MWLLCDYGEVLSLPQPADDLKRMIDVSQCDEATFLKQYWAHRPSYDRGDLSSTEYWGLVLGKSVDEARLQTLSELDVRSWMHPCTPSLEATARAAQRGYRLAILSNAPAELADTLDGVPWLAAFEPKIFSCRLRAIKPDATIFEQTLAILTAAPADVVFLDDRATNVEGARRVGIIAHLFTDPSQIDVLV